MWSPDQEGIHGFLRRVEALPLEAGRSLAVEELQSAKLDPHLRDLALRRVAEQRSKEGLLESLRALALSLKSHWGSISITPPGPVLRRLAAQKVSGTEGEQHYALISVDEILYVFVGRALGRGLVRTPWTQMPALHAGRMYVRTGRDLLVTHYRSVADLQERLDPQQFFPVQQSVLVNLERIADLDFGGKVPRAGIVVADGSREWVILSRRAVKILRQQLGIARRR